MSIILSHFKSTRSLIHQLRTLILLYLRRVISSFLWLPPLGFIFECLVFSTLSHHHLAWSVEVCVCVSSVCLCFISTCLYCLCEFSDISLICDIDKPTSTNWCPVDTVHRRESSQHDTPKTPIIQDVLLKESRHHRSLPLHLITARTLSRNQLSIQGVGSQHTIRFVVYFFVICVIFWICARAPRARVANCCLHVLWRLFCVFSCELSQL